MKARLLASLALAATIAMASGCSADPTPVETAQAFASEEEAFAAAEETYRAYVDALNQVDLSDPATFEPVFALTTGDANADERTSLSTMHADGWTVSGESNVVTIARRSVSDDFSTVGLHACVDVADITLEDSSGASVVADDRPGIQSLQIDMLQDPGSSTFTVHRIVGDAGESGC